MRQSRHLEHTGHNQARAAVAVAASDRRAGASRLSSARRDHRRGGSRTRRRAAPSAVHVELQPLRHIRTELAQSSHGRVSRRSRRPTVRVTVTVGPRRLGRLFPAPASPARTAGPVPEAPRSNSAPCRSSPGAMATRWRPRPGVCIRRIFSVTFFTHSLHCNGENHQL